MDQEAIKMINKHKVAAVLVVNRMIRSRVRGVAQDLNKMIRSKGKADRVAKRTIRSKVKADWEVNNKINNRVRLKGVAALVSKKMRIKAKVADRVLNKMINKHKTDRQLKRISKLLAERVLVSKKMSSKGLAEQVLISRTISNRVKGVALLISRAISKVLAKQVSEMISKTKGKDVALVASMMRKPFNQAAAQEVQAASRAMYRALAKSNSITPEPACSMRRLRHCKTGCAA